jgi:hypothetical protein
LFIQRDDTFLVVWIIFRVLVRVELVTLTTSNLNLNIDIRSVGREVGFKQKVAILSLHGTLLVSGDFSINRFIIILDDILRAEFPFLNAVTRVTSRLVLAGTRLALAARGLFGLGAEVLG